MTDTIATPLAQGRALPLSAVIAILGVTQIIGYGTVYYAFALIAPSIAGEFGTDATTPFVALSAALLAGGLLSPWIGRIVDRFGASRVMTAGSLAVGLAYIALAIAPAFPILAVLIVVLQILSVAVLYGASFPTLAAYGGDKARRAITVPTLIGGIASTLYWPLTGWLVETTGWRGTFWIFSAMHLLIALPLHAWIMLRAPASASLRTAGDAPREGLVPLEHRRYALLAVAISFALTGIFSTALIVHLVPVLERAGLAENTYLVSMLIGPAMVGIRLLEAVFAKWTSPLATTIVASLCFPLAALLLVSGLPVIVAGIAFALLYGFGHGLNVIVGGTLPLALFGRDGYGETLGTLNAVRAILSAAAPTLFAFALSAIGFIPTMTIGATIGLTALIPLLLLSARLKRDRQQSVILLP